MAAPATKLTEPSAAELWADDVLAGNVVVGKLVRLAVERQAHDLEHGIERGLYFDRDAAQRAIDWYQFCRHYEGEMAGEILDLEPWQQWITWVSYGWRRVVDGYRRYRERLIEVARANGKSTWMAGDGNFHFIAENEPGAQVYTAATKREQATIVWGCAARMVEQSPELSKMVKVRDSVNSHHMSIAETNARFLPLSAESRKMDGLNPNAIIIDEFHEHADRKLYDKLKTAMGKRRQPMLTLITTAGEDAGETIYEDIHGYAVDVLGGFAAGDFVDDRLFAFIACIDDDDDPFDESCWPKANPNLGVSVDIDHLREMSQRAQRMPSEMPTFLRMHCNRRATSEVRAISIEDWDACRAEIDWNDFKGSDCIGALDLSSTIDLTALTLHFERDELHYYRFFTWMPEEQVAEACRRDHVPYDVWIKQGWLLTTPGNQIDDVVIARKVMECSEEYNVIEWTNDPWHAVQLGNALEREAGIVVVKFLQDLKNFGEPTMYFLDEITTHKMRHDGNPLARWCAGNVVTKEDAQGDKRPHKKASKKRIDPITAAVMARGRAIVAKPAPSLAVYTG
jgi:phage terminase large subunit-like protein